MDVFTSVADVPLDSYVPGSDQIDTPDGHKAARQVHPFLPAPKTATPPKGFVIPYTRTLKAGSRGRDVIGAKRAIWRAEGLPVPVGATPLFGPTAVKELKRFQASHGLKATGALDEGTLKLLAPYFDAYAYLEYVGVAPGKSALAQARARFNAYMLWGYNNRDLLHYVQARPMDNLSNLEVLPDSDDCSEWYTKGCKYAGFKDPNHPKGGAQYDGSGWTGTIAAFCSKVGSQSSLLVGDAVLYGPAPDFEHVAGYIGSGRVCSFGSDPGPLILPVAYRTDVGAYRRPSL